MPEDMVEPDLEDDSFDRWAATVELRLGRTRVIAMASGGIAVGALALGILAFKGVANLANALNQIAQMQAGIPPNGIPMPEHQGATLDPMEIKVGPRPGAPIRVVDPLDETRTPPPGKVAKPAEGPASEVSEETARQLLSQPVVDAKGPGVAGPSATDMGAVEFDPEHHYEI